MHRGWLVIERGLHVVLPLPRLDLLVIDGSGTTLGKRKTPLPVATADEDAASNNDDGKNREGGAQGDGEGLVIAPVGRRTGILRSPGANGITDGGGLVCGSEGHDDEEEEEKDEGNGSLGGEGKKKTANVTTCLGADGQLQAWKRW